MNRTYYILFLILCFFGTLNAQVTVSGSWDQDTIVIGDQVGFTLSIEAENSVQILAVANQFLDSIYSAVASLKAQVDTSQPVIPKIADFELLDLGLWTAAGEDATFAGPELNWTTAQAGNKTLYQNTFTLRVWDPGEIIMLFPPVLYSINGEQDQTYNEEQARLFVAPPGGMAAQDSMSIAEIKPIIEEPVKLSDYMIYFIIIGVVLLGALFYWWFSKYRAKAIANEQEIVIPEVIIPAHVKALDKLQELRNQELWQNGKIKEYQSELTYIVREYLENRYDIQALESTTDEIVNQYLKGLLDGEDVNSLQRILQVADLVKFAKAKPDEEVHESFMNEAFQFVEKTKRIETPNIDE